MTEVVSTIDPAFPAVGPASTCDAGKKGCVLQRTACLLKAQAAVGKKGVLVDAAAVQACADRFDGGAKGFAKGCLGKLEAKQNPEKPKTLCGATGEVSLLEGIVDSFVTDTLGAILQLD